MLIIMVGIPGSGKTSLVREMVEKWNIKCVSSDDVRRKILSSIGHPGLYHPSEIDGISNEKFMNLEYKVWKKIENDIYDELSFNGVCILDATNVDHVFYKMWYSMADLFDVRLKFVIMETNFLEAYNRNKNRDRFVPDNVMVSMNDKLNKAICYMRHSDEFKGYAGIIYSGKVLELNPFK